MKKGYLISAAAALVAAAVATPANAQVGPYLGFGLGRSKINDVNANGTISTSAGPVNFNSIDYGGSKTSFQVNGGYQITPEIGVQLQYTYLGKRDATVLLSGAVTGVISVPEIKAHEWGAAGTYTLRLGQFWPEATDWFLWGKLGVSDNWIQGTCGTFNGTTTSVTKCGSDKSHTDILAGFGGGYEWSKEFSTKLEYEYFGKFTDSDQASATGSNIGLRMKYVFTDFAF